jgi:hypothetical protein
MVSGCSGENKLKDSILNKKPVFSLKIHGFGTRYRILINNIKVYEEKNDASQVTTSIPLNHWMKAGGNSLKLLVYPNNEDAPINEKSEVNAELYVANDEIDEKYRIGGFNFKGLGHIPELDLLEYRLETDVFKHDDEGELLLDHMNMNKYLLSQIIYHSGHFLRAMMLLMDMNYQMKSFGNCQLNCVII